MEKLLEKSRAALLAPSESAKRKLLITINVGCVLGIITFISLEKASTGVFVHKTGLFFFVYLPVLVFNFLSAIYNINAHIFQKKPDKQLNAFWYKLLVIYAKRLDVVSTMVSLSSIMFLSVANMTGYGNPSSDMLIMDFMLPQVIILIATILGGRFVGGFWTIIVFTALLFNMNNHGWDYQFHYMTPQEAKVYELALGNQEDWALKRQEVLKENRLEPPKATRYFNALIVFITLAFMASFFFYGITNDVLKKLPNVVDDIGKAIKDSHRRNQMLEQQEQLNHAFMNLAHEIRTPLTLIHNKFQEFKNPNGNNEDFEFIKAYQEKIKEDVETYFDIVSIQNGNSPYDHNTTIDFSKILSDVITLFQSYSKHKGITISSQIESVYIKADPNAIHKVINNLIHNAIKYSPSDSNIDVKLLKHKEVAVFSVKDQGIGIEPELKEKIFDKFFRIKAKKRSVDGLGLGLAIVKAIINDLQGEINVESILNEGTEFVVQLNTTEELPNSTDFNASIPSHIRLKHRDINDWVIDDNRPSILVVEDNVDLLLMIQSYLKGQYNVYLAPNAETAIEKLSSEITYVDLIISDVMMNDIDGFEFIELIYQQEHLRQIPVIFLTAKNSQSDRQKGLKRAFNYIPKPFDMTELGLIINSYLSNIEHRDEALVRETLTTLKKQGRSKVSPVKKDFNQYHLTPRELEILPYLTTRMTYKQIADKLNNQESTIKTHSKNIREKMQVQTRKEVADIISDIESVNV